MNENATQKQHPEGSTRTTPSPLLLYTSVWLWSSPVINKKNTQLPSLQDDEDFDNLQNGENFKGWDFPSGFSPPLALFKNWHPIIEREGNCGCLLIC